MNSLLVRAIAAFLAMPGVVAFAIPLLLFGPVDRLRTFTRLALVPLLAGSALLLWCVREFYVAGKGTLAPWSPPRRVVTTGPYRWSRNPMYVGVLLILCGWAWGSRSRGLVIYTIGVAMAFHLRVVFGEEPWLARTHGDEWLPYRAEVRRWFGRRRFR